MSGIKSKMIIANDTSLHNYLVSNHCIPVTYFDSDIPSAISLGIAHLRERKDGELYVPQTDSHKPFRIKLHRNKNDVVTINFIVENYRYPINSETRPYGGEWELGDVVLNNDITTNKCLGWVCIKGGIPGVWETFCSIKPWYTHIEVVNVLPDPSEMQYGRQLICNIDDSTSQLYYCNYVNGSYQWIPQHSTMSESVVQERVQEILDRYLYDDILNSVESNLERVVEDKVTNKLSNKVSYLVIGETVERDSSLPTYGIK